MSSFVGKPLTRWDKAFLVLVALGILLFSAIVEKRSAFMRRRMTDADCCHFATVLPKAKPLPCSVEGSSGKRIDRHVVLSPQSPDGSRVPPRLPLASGAGPLSRALVARNIAAISSCNSGFQL